MTNAALEKLSTLPHYRLNFFNSIDVQTILEIVKEKGSITQFQLTKELRDTDKIINPKLKKLGSQSLLSQFMKRMYHIGILEGIKVGKFVHTGIVSDNVELHKPPFDIESMMNIKPSTPSGELKSITPKKTA